MTREAGYTLLELLVVMAVMALIAAAIPGVALPGIAGVRLSGRVAEVAFRLNRARELAIDTGQAVILRLDTITTSTDMFVQGSGSSNEIRFFPDGSSSGGRWVFSLGGRHRILVVDPLTARLTVESSG